MTERVKEDEVIKDYADRTIIFRPVIVIEAIDDKKVSYRLHLSELDQMMTQPKTYGIVLSDLLDHIAAFYAQQSGRDQRDIRYEILKVFRDEDRFKDKDPDRGQQRGFTIMPKKN
jgi:hypothetical protein